MIAILERMSGGAIVGDSDKPLKEAIYWKDDPVDYPLAHRFEDRIIILQNKIEITTDKELRERGFNDLEIAWAAYHSKYNLYEARDTIKYHVLTPKGIYTLRFMTVSGDWFVLDNYGHFNDPIWKQVESEHTYL